MITEWIIFIYVFVVVVMVMVVVVVVVVAVGGWLPFVLLWWLLVNGKLLVPKIIALSFNGLRVKTLPDSFRSDDRTDFRDGDFCKKDDDDAGNDTDDVNFGGLIFSNCFILSFSRPLDVVRVVVLGYVVEPLYRLGVLCDDEYELP